MLWNRKALIMIEALEKVSTDSGRWNRNLAMLKRGQASDQWAFFNALVTRIAVHQGVGLGDVTDMAGGATHGSSRKEAAPKAAFFY